MQSQPKTSKEILDAIDYGVRLGAARALAQHKKDGRSIVVSKDGKVVHIPPEEILIPEEFKDLVDKNG